MTLAERLAEAEAAYHRLQIGQAAVAVHDQNGERIEFRPATVRYLAAYIEDLRRQIAGQSRPREVRITASKGLT
ncbi:MAG: gpW family head-tail joining protein [Pseudomonadota bacterium]